MELSEATLRVKRRLKEKTSTVLVPRKRKRNNHHPVIGWFLTYPQCKHSKEDLLAHLTSLGKGLSNYVICRELHESGDPHLHAFAKFDDGVTWDFAKKGFDLKENHGSYEPARSWKHVIKYVRKDGDYISSHTIDDKTMV